MHTALGIAFSLWIIIGFVAVRHGDAGWIAMIADERNCNHPWLAWPVLILMWIMWPLHRAVSRQCFLIIWSLGL